MTHPPRDISDTIALIQVQFKTLGMGFNHPRVVAWMQRCGFETKHHISPEAYQSLAKKLHDLPLNRKTS